MFWSSDIPWGVLHQTRICKMEKNYAIDYNFFSFKIVDIITFLVEVFAEMGARDGVVVKALRYKPAGCGFDSRWCHCNFSVT
jgi:hypothetical protein